MQQYESISHTLREKKPGQNKSIYLFHLNLLNNKLPPNLVSHNSDSLFFMIVWNSRGFLCGLVSDWIWLQIWRDCKAQGDLTHIPGGAWLSSMWPRSPSRHGDLRAASRRVKVKPQGLQSPGLTSGPAFVPLDSVHQAKSKDQCRFKGRGTRSCLLIRKCYIAKGHTYRNGRHWCHIFHRLQCSLIPFA